MVHDDIDAAVIAAALRPTVAVMDLADEIGLGVIDQMMAPSSFNRWSLASE
jgi:hypothetical protein